MNWKSAPRLCLILLGINAPSPLFLWFTLNMLGYEIGFLLCALVVLMLVGIGTLTAMFIRTLPLWINMTDDGWMRIEDSVPEDGKIIVAFYRDERRLLIRHGRDWYEAQEFNGLTQELPEDTVWQYLPREPVKPS